MQTGTRDDMRLLQSSNRSERHISELANYLTFISKIQRAGRWIVHTPYAGAGGLCTLLMLIEVLGGSVLKRKLTNSTRDRAEKRRGPKKIHEND